MLATKHIHRFVAVIVLAAVDLCQKVFHKCHELPSRGSMLSWTMFLATLSFVLGSCRQCYLHCMGRTLLWRWLQELANHYVCLWSRWPILIQQLGSLWAHSNHWWTNRYTQSFTLSVELCTLPFSVDHKTLPTWHTCNQSQRIQYQ